MSKHTPGEWVVNYDEVCVRSNADDQSFGMLVPIAAVMNDDQEANARLIAAAPDLLAALIGLDEAFCSINEFSTKEERHDARLKLIAARSAVAKATGQVPA